MDAHEWAESIVGDDYEVKEVAPNRELTLAYSTPHITSTVTIISMRDDLVGSEAVEVPDTTKEGLVFFQTVTTDYPQIVIVRTVGQGWEKTANKLLVPGAPNLHVSLSRAMRRSRHYWRDRGRAHMAAPNISLDMLKIVDKKAPSRLLESTILLAQHLIRCDAASDQSLTVLRRCTRSQLRSILPESMVWLAELSPKSRALVLNGVAAYRGITAPPE